MELGLDARIIGLTGSHWNNAVWEKLVSQGTLHESKHRFCTLGIRQGEKDIPSNVCIKVISIRKHAHTPCTCGIPFDKHQSDWNHKHKETNIRNHWEALLDFYIKIKDKGIYEFG